MAATNRQEEEKDRFKGGRSVNRTHARTHPVDLILEDSGDGACVYDRIDGIDRVHGLP